ncbi:hypothetical protein [Synechococcus sp. PCC 6312]|uniref:hypothetical protein n=1 Tax=Synechococcus sp. (strain ATCC 27167 / PCC 6312) TaxID=195253 RepID=UPI00029F0980|nr:hypothetical protein [Synechococcus sp. PCC 6312]AFY60073.1 hypothetical protein Syn6312_0863 [Synechococcus sp. PCC 6312]
MITELIDKYEAAKILGLKSPDGLKYLEKKGVIKPDLIKHPSSRVKKFVRILVEDLACNFDDPVARQWGIERFYAELNLLSNHSGIPSSSDNF